MAISKTRIFFKLDMRNWCDLWRWFAVRKWKIFVIDDAVFVILVGGKILLPHIVDVIVNFSHHWQEAFTLGIRCNFLVIRPLSISHFVYVSQLKKLPLLLQFIHRYHTDKKQVQKFVNNVWIHIFIDKSVDTCVNLFIFKCICSFKKKTD